MRILFNYQNKKLISRSIKKQKNNMYQKKKLYGHLLLIFYNIHIS
jgi:hypothetical protein